MSILQVQGRERCFRWRLTGNLAVLFALAVTLVTPPGAAAAPTIDQQQVKLNTSIGLYIGGNSEEKLAQVVTSGIAGLLTEVRVPLGCDNAAKLTLEILDANTEPGAMVLASSTFPGSSFSSSDVQFRSLPLATPPFIPAETQFAFVLSASGNCGLVPGPVGDSYLRGNMYFDARPNPAGVWLCNCGFAGASNDLAFQTYVDPVCKVPNVVGQRRTESEATITRYGCTLGSVTTRFSSAPAGVVLEESPDAGTQLPSASAVDLVVSRGAAPCIVPNVLGKTLRRAEAAIGRANCSLGHVARAYSSRVVRGRVIAQRPRPRVQIRSRARVNLVVSRGARR